MTSHDSATKPGSDKSDYYVLSASYYGTTRLALQSLIWREALGFSIHPQIVPHLPDNAKIADVAAGTALWSRDVALEFGGKVASIDALDINLIQAPPEQWLPSCIKLHNWNMFDELPSQFVGKYDLVHVRAIWVALKDNNAEPIVRQLQKLLSTCKPGGWLQWEEGNIFEAMVIKATADLDVPHMDEWCAWMKSPKVGINVSASESWTNSTQESLRAHGFEAVEERDHTEEFTRPENLSLMRYNSDQLLMMSEQLAVRRYAEGHAERTRLLEIIAGAAKDAEKGSALVVPPISWTAKKAG